MTVWRAKCVAFWNALNIFEPAVLAVLSILCQSGLGGGSFWDCGCSLFSVLLSFLVCFQHAAVCLFHLAWRVETDREILWILWHRFSWGNLWIFMVSILFLAQEQVPPQYSMSMRNGDRDLSVIWAENMGIRNGKTDWILSDSVPDILIRLKQQ